MVCLTMQRTSETQGFVWDEGAPGPEQRIPLELPIGTFRASFGQSKSGQRQVGPAETTIGFRVAAHSALLTRILLRDTLLRQKRAPSWLALGEQHD